jgi:hypothetical protein
VSYYIDSDLGERVRPMEGERSGYRDDTKTTIKEGDFFHRKTA